MKRLILLAVVAVLAGCGSGGGGGGGESSSGPVAVATSSVDGSWKYADLGSEKGWLDTMLLSNVTLSGGVFRSTEPSLASTPLVDAVTHGFINRSRDGVYSVSGNTIYIKDVIGNKGGLTEYKASDTTYTFTLNGNTLIFSTPDGNRTFLKQ